MSDMSSSSQQEGEMPSECDPDAVTLPLDLDISLLHDPDNDSNEAALTVTGLKLRKQGKFSQGTRGRRRITSVTSVAHTNYTAMRNIIIKKKQTYARVKEQRRLYPQLLSRTPAPLEDPELEYYMNPEEEEVEPLLVDEMDESSGSETDVSVSPEPDPVVEHLFPNLSPAQIIQYFSARGQLIVLPKPSEGPGLSSIRVEPPATPELIQSRQWLTAELEAARKTKEQENLENIPLTERSENKRKVKPTQRKASAALFVNASDSSETRKEWYDKVRSYNIRPSTKEHDADYSALLSVVGEDEPDPDSLIPENLHEVNFDGRDTMTEPLSLADLDMPERKAPEDTKHIYVDMSTAHTETSISEFQNGGLIYPKPPMPYSCIIALALKNSLTGILPVSQIYKFSCDHFPYFRNAPSGWKNSIRHNLSLNKLFMKVEINPGDIERGRRALSWTMDITSDPSRMIRMDKELQKWFTKPPPDLLKSMSDPENRDILLLGELKRDYRVAKEEEEEEEPRIQEPTPQQPLPSAAFTGTVGQIRAYLQSQHSSSMAMLSVDAEDGGTSMIEPIGVGPLLPGGPGQYLHQVSQGVYRISSFAEPPDQQNCDSTPLILRRAPKLSLSPSKINSNN